MKKQALALAMGAALVSGAASASYINVGGVVWDPDSIDDHMMTDTMYETVAAGIGGTISGYGKILNMNGDSAATFCPSCELTYQFGGFTLTGWLDLNSDTIINGGDAISFTGGWVNFYVDSTPNFSSGATGYADAGDGNLWLALTATTQTASFGSGSLTGTLFSQLQVGTLGTGTEGGTGFGNFDVVAGGLATGNFDTNTQANGSDFRFTSSFQPRNANGAAAGFPYVLFGSNDMFGDSIPEPGSLALIGLGLIGLGAGAMRRRKTA